MLSSDERQAAFGFAGTTRTRPTRCNVSYKRYCNVLPLFGVSYGRVHAKEACRASAVAERRLIITECCRNFYMVCNRMVGGEKLISGASRGLSSDEREEEKGSHRRPDVRQCLLSNGSF